MCIVLAPRCCKEWITNSFESKSNAEDASNVITPTHLLFSGRSFIFSDRPITASDVQRPLLNPYIDEGNKWSIFSECCLFIANWTTLPTQDDNATGR